MAYELLHAEFTLKKILKSNETSLVIPGNPNILCTPFPSHWRVNKALIRTFKVFSLLPVEDGTQVILSAGNNENFCAELRGFQAQMKNQTAIFQDLRFLGKSGRGKRFNITITMESDPPQVSVYTNAIKVTVDGPREPRSKNGLLVSKTSKHIRQSPCKFPIHSSPVIDKQMLLEVLEQTDRIRRLNLKRLYTFSDKEIEIFVDDVYKRRKNNRNASLFDRESSEHSSQSISSEEDGGVCHHDQNTQIISIQSPNLLQLVEVMPKGFQIMLQDGTSNNDDGSLDSC